MTWLVVLLEWAAAWLAAGLLVAPSVGRALRRSQPPPALCTCGHRWWLHDQDAATGTTCLVCDPTTCPAWTPRRTE